MYELDEDKNPVGYSTSEFLERNAGWSGADERRVGLDKVGSYEVSTVFLNIDHNFGFEGGPILFETMVFDDSDDLLCHRYRTWAEASEGHTHVVNALKQGLKPEEISRMTWE
jgi:hypothetical protein|tara:strand:- start:478 stop:813 length:336 start_codon:yes stop_codon:yes gene_type:complete